jgi:hypothetical protein
MARPLIHALLWCSLVSGTAVAQTTITSLSPASIAVGSASFTLTVNGTGFGPLMPIQWDGATQATTFVSSTQLTCTITAAMVSTTGPHNVRVRITALPPTFTNTVVFNVVNPTPVVTSMSPTSVNAGLSGLLLIIGGSGFNSSTTVTADGTPLTISSVSATNLNASVPGSLLALGATISIVVSNPSPGGGSAAPQTLTVNNPAPLATGLNPSSTLVTPAAVPINVSGLSFNAASVVRLNGVNLPTTFNGVASLSATLPAGTAAVASTHTITVFTPAPGGGTSGALTFSALNPVPTLTSITPTSVFAGAPDTTVTLVGTNFNGQSVVRRNGVDLATTFVSATQLTAVIPAANLATVNSATLAVVNPAPGGGGSGGQTFSAVNHAVPTLASISPSSLIVQTAPATITVTGTGFDPFTVVRFNGVDCPTTFVSTTTATAVLSGTQVSVASVASITAFNPTPGGGTSAAVSFTVGNPAPVASALSPSSVFGGMFATVLVSGSGFLPTSVVRLNGVPVTSFMINANTLNCSLQASALGAIGVLSIDVQNPGLGGGTSAALPLTVTGQPVPTIASLSPISAHAVLGGILVTVSGTGFTPLTSATFNGLTQTTNFISSTLMTVTLSPSVAGTPGVGTLILSNPAPGGGVSNGATLTVTTPAPILTGASPSTLTASFGAGNATVILSGTDFHFLSEVYLVGSPPFPLASTGGVGGTLITTVPGSKRAAPGTLTFFVSNPSPGGGDSAGIPVTVVAPVPSLSTISPSTVIGGSPATTLTLAGTGFLAGSQLFVDGVPIPSTTLSSTSMQCTLPATFLSATGYRAFTVFNSGPGGGLSSESYFTVTGPVIASASPAVLSPLVPASPPVVFTLSGTFPSPSSTVFADGIPLPSTWVNASTMTCVVDGSLSAALQPGGFALTVVQQPVGLGAVASNAFGVTVGVAGSPDNAGTVTVVPRPAAAGQEFFLRVEAPVVGQPLTLVADFTQTALVPLVFSPTFDVVAGVLFGTPFPLVDGLGLFGAPAPALFRADDLSVFGVPNPRGVFDLRGLVAPPVPFGVTFRLQAIYLDPAQPFGFNVSHVNPQSL